MELGVLQNLELLPKILEKVAIMQERLDKFAPPLTTKKEVASFLKVTPRTLNNYIANGYLQEGYHFHRKNGKVLVFIEDAIIEFRNKRDKGMVNEKVAI